MANPGRIQASVGHACEKGKPQHDSSARGGQFVPRRAAETAFSKPLKAKQFHGKIQAPSGSQFLFKGLGGACVRNRETPAGFKLKGCSIRPLTGCRNSIFETVKSKAKHGKPWQDSSLKRKPIPPCKGFCGACMRNRETPAGFKRKAWSIRPLTRCRNSIFETVKSKTMANPGKSQAPSGSQFLLKGLGGACMRNRETPAGFKRKGWSIRPQTGCRNSLFETVKSKTMANPAGFKPQAEANSTSKGSVGHACKTGKPQQEPSARGGQFVP